MRTTNSLLLAIPLGAGLLVIGCLALDLPGAAERPASLFSMSINGHPVEMENAAVARSSIDVNGALELIDVEPAKVVFLETVVLQGTVGDKKEAIRELRILADDDAIGVLSLALADDNRQVQKAALEALSRIGTDGALAAIASASATGDPRLRARATEALAMTGGYSAVDYIELALSDEDPRVRLAAAESLGDIGDSRSINIISGALRDPDPDVRRRAAELLDQLDDDALFHALYPAR